ncbi:MAG: 16S rRNA (uracil(1498)-N(3))-methyltransferase [Spirochaetales bacterium]|jgi:16S rRNA (uracil1498-N3)-methyltransferase|nr:16S rRNA (uracil(1498)-N(3))-methyltransferase [Spirochaetales bacterium]
MKVFVLPAGFEGGDFLDLAGDDYHYLCRVRRLKTGGSFPAVDARGREYHLTLESAGRKSCRLRVQKKGSSLPAAGEESLVLYQCLPKGAKFDMIVRQAVELGAARIVPVRSRFSVPRLTDAEGRLERWRRIAREAVQQSGAYALPEISAPVSFDGIPEDFGESREGEKKLGIFFHQNPLAISSLHGYLSSGPREIALVVGPEGGLADEEVQLLLKAGFVPAYLGHRVLRTETAPVFAAAAVRIILLEKERWNLANGNRTYQGDGDPGRPSAG